VNRARANEKLMDWRPVIELRDTILDGGRRFLVNLIAGLKTLGVDTTDPLQLILATRRIGGARMEELFGVGEPDSSYPRGFTPLVATDTVRRLMSNVDVVLRELREHGAPDLTGLRVVTASGDIHEYGLFVVSKVLSDLGAKVVDLGTSMSSRDIAKVAVETAADVVAVSTYNGMALSLGRQLLDELHSRHVAPAVFLGGRLNEDLEGESAADVSPQLRLLGITPCPTLHDMIHGLREQLTAGQIAH
jgi:methylmalonyl-CoA mutase cobalamin-binding domain/chain